MFIDRIREYQNQLDKINSILNDNSLKDELNPMDQDERFWYLIFLQKEKAKYEFIIREIKRNRFVD